MQCARIDRALEVDHFPNGLPVVHPAPTVKFGFRGDIEAKIRIRPAQAQQEPALLLTQAERPHIVAQITLRQAVTQPMARAADDLHVLWRKANLLVELAIKRILGAFTATHATLGKLPAAPTRTAREKHL